MASKVRDETVNDIQFLDQGAGDPAEEGFSRYAAGFWRQLDSVGVFSPVQARVSANDTTADYLEDKLPTGGDLNWTTNNDGGNENLTATVSADAAYNININPETLTTSGNNPSHIQAGDAYSALEFLKGQTDYGTWSTQWQRNPSGNVTIRIQFCLRASASGTIVRIGVKVKSRATGEDIADPFDSEVVDAVTVNTTNIGDIFEANLSISAAIFAEDDATGIAFGRDGNDEITGGASDDFNEKIFIKTIRIHVP